MFSKIAFGSRLLLGLLFFVFGLNGFLFFTMGKSFLPMPAEVPPAMITIMTGFLATGYLLPLAKLLQIISGLMLLSGFYVNAALVMLGPILVNIVLIHVFAERSGLPMAIFFLILYLIVLISRWADFRQLLKR